MKEKINPSLKLLKSLAEEAVFPSRSGRFDQKLCIEEDMPGLVNITHRWREWTGMGTEQEHKHLYNGSNEMAFELLCKWANPE